MVRANRLLQLKKASVHPLCNNLTLPYWITNTVSEIPIAQIEVFQSFLLTIVLLFCPPFRQHMCIGQSLLFTFICWIVFYFKVITGDKQQNIKRRFQLYIDFRIAIKPSLFQRLQCTTLLNLLTVGHNSLTLRNKCKKTAKVFSLRKWNDSLSGWLKV